MAVDPIPEGYRTVTPYLVVDGAAQLLEFTKQAFGAEELVRMDAPGGKVGHAEIRIGDSMLMLADTVEMADRMPAMIHLYVEDCDKTYRRALEAGATSLQEPENKFYGDRNAGVLDAVGNKWWISTHVEDVPPEEMEERAKAAMQQQ